MSMKHAAGKCESFLWCSLYFKYIL